MSVRRTINENPVAATVFATVVLVITLGAVVWQVRSSHGYKEGSGETVATIDDGQTWFSHDGKHGRISNVKFRNINFQKAKQARFHVEGYCSQDDINDVEMSDIHVNGKRMNNRSDGVFEVVNTQRFSLR